MSGVGSPVKGQSTAGPLPADAVLRRDDTAALFAEYQSRLAAAVRHAVATSPANIEDACAFAWLQLVRCRPEPAGAFAWLRTTALRKAIQLERRSRRTLALDHVDESAQTDPRADLEHRLELLAAGQVLAAAGLRTRERRVLSLRALGYSRAEAARITGDSCRTVDRQLRRAVQKLNMARRRGRARA